MMRLQCVAKEMAARMGETWASCWSCLTGSLLLVACASVPPPSARDLADANDTGRAVTATNASERALLLQLPGLPTGASRRIGNTTVIAEALYSSGSGRSCRAVHITASTTEASHRLACTDGTAWFFVPDVFGAAAVK